jgi:5,5'-dehydrodivanillate O-demethylase oxygenase subunit
MVASETESTAAVGLDLAELAHTDPGTIGGTFMRCFWHPVYRGEDLPAGRAKPIRIMGEDFTLYRGEGGQVHAVGFRCAHRGTQMSTGWVEGDNLRCFYHGWVYGPDGQCVEQPAEPEPFCNRIKIRSFPVEEYLGLIFVYQGEEEPPPLQRWAVGDKATLTETELFSWPYNYWQSLDNKMDYAHQPFVHQRGGSLKPRANAINGYDLSKLPELKLAETDWGFVGWRNYPSGITRTEHIVMPNVFLHKSRPGNPRPGDPAVGWSDTIRWIVPVDDANHLEISLYLGSATEEEARQYRETRAEALKAQEQLPVYELVQAVLEGRMTIEELARYNMVGGSLQDAVARWGQGTLADRHQDHLGYADAAPFLYRQLVLREMKALAEGQPLKQWSCPETLQADWD